MPSDAGKSDRAPGLLVRLLVLPLGLRRVSGGAVVFHMSAAGQNVLQSEQQ